MSDDGLRLTDYGREAVQSFDVHEPTAYGCSQRPEDGPMDSDAVCLPCDGLDAWHWRQKAKVAEAVIADVRALQKEWASDTRGMGWQYADDLTVALDGAEEALRQQGGSL